MITLGSRYQDQPIVPALLPNGSVQSAVYRTTMYSTQGGVRYHLWQSSDRIDRVSERYLGNPDLWWQIMDINPEVMDPFAITPGTLLKVPTRA